MNSKTQELTFGAMLAAVYGVLLLLNRQTGGLFEEFILFVLPVPMAIFTLRYGWKDGLPVLASMFGLSIFLGTLYTLFFASCNAAIGLVLGARLKSRRDLNQTQLIIMLLSSIVNVIGTVLLASVFGFDVHAEVTQLQTTMSSAFAQYGFPAEAVSMVLEYNMLLRLYILSMVLMGVMQGFIIMRLSLLIMKRLRLPVPVPAPIGLYFPPVWTGYLAIAFLVLFQFFYQSLEGNTLLQSILQTAGTCGSFYLMMFGWIALVLIVRKYIPGPRFLGAVIAFAAVLMLSYMVITLGAAYILSASFHRNLLQPRSQ